MGRSKNNLFDNRVIVYLKQIDYKANVWPVSL